MSVFSPEVVVENTVLVDGSAVTQPISATTLPLPTGAATNSAVTALTKPSDIQLVDGSAHTQPVSGTVSVGNVVSVITAVAATATITQVVLTNNTNGTLLAANVSRKSAVIFVPSATLQIKYGATASATSFTYKTTSNNTTLTITGYTGQIDAFGSGQTVTITELS